MIAELFTEAHITGVVFGSLGIALCWRSWLLAGIATLCVLLLTPSRSSTFADLSTGRPVPVIAIPGFILA